MEFQSTSPTVKYEQSPLEAYVPASGDDLTSLFTPTTPSSASTMNPLEMMTPQSYSDDKSRLSVVPEENTEDDLDDEAPAGSEKKAKKRKSWGQVLPEPKTNLPPRKRAKTDDEKEQRRVERVLRNRRAAQSSRERKRLEVEALEKRNKELETLLLNAQKANLALVEELNRVRRDSGVSTRSSSPLDSLRDDQVTLSQQLFGPQDKPKTPTPRVDGLILSTAIPTVNPASISPERSPVPDAPSAAPEMPSSEAALASSPDLTQRPAEMLCDLQCQTSAELPKSFLNSQTPASPPLAWTIFLHATLASASAILSACRRPLTQIAMSSRAGFSLLPSPRLLATIIWLVTIPPATASTSSTWTTSSTTKQTTSPPTLWQRATSPLRTTASSCTSKMLRFKSIRQILSSSPNLARPLMDATMVAMRLASAQGCDDRFLYLPSESGATREQVSELVRCWRGVALPSSEVLLALLWTLKVEERRIRQREGRAVRETNHGIPPVEQPSKGTYVLKVAKRLRRGRQNGGGGVSKRLRLP
ncbi:hypothetical protein RJ55_02662 [Drechmeria coniospora]|nr:hypothetical protein RJ55_02662 [Drechmeria coniospora]